MLISGFNGRMEMIGQKHNIQSYKGKVETYQHSVKLAQTRLSQTSPENLAQASSISPKRDCSSNVGPFSCFSPRQTQ